MMKVGSKFIVSIVAGPLFAALLAPMTAAGNEYSAAGVTVVDPWARATPGGMTIGAAYLEIKAGKETQDRLLGVRSGQAGRAELHTHINQNGVMKMRRMEGLDVKPGGSHVLAPGGDHIMLFDLKKPLKAGDLLPLTLVFEKAGDIDIEAKVAPIGAMGPAGSNRSSDHEVRGSPSGHDHH